MVYSYQAPDFETKSDNGETLVLEHRIVCVCTLCDEWSAAVWLRPS